MLSSRFIHVVIIYLSYKWKPKNRKEAGMGDEHLEGIKMGKISLRTNVLEEAKHTN